jgi:thiosulfate reductase/polysulfide reductase chain A
VANQQIYSICGMCSVRCPIQVEVRDNRVSFFQGNPHAAGLEGALCARGGAGVALLEDNERPQHPLIRVGQRGEGKWRQVGWDEALDYTATRLKEVMGHYGAKTVLFSDRGGPFGDLHKAFVRGLGSPNYANHDSSCAGNVNHAALSTFGFGRTNLVYDYKNARHVVLQTRNIFEAINVKEVNDLMSGLEQGCKLTVIDIRASISASKADRFLLIRPGTDYALNLAVIHELLTKKLYDEAFAAQWIKDLDQLAAFVTPYTPEWAAAETGINAQAIRDFTRDLAQAAPAVIWHPGWMNARYRNSFYMSRTVYLINALLGSIGAKGGLPLTNKPGDVGHKGLKNLVDLFPQPQDQRADGVGWRYPHFDSGSGQLHLAFQAIESEDPYPVKAYIAYRHDPLMACPDPEALKKIFDNLDLLVAVTFSWSDTAWYADVVLPLSTYLERESILACKNGLKPYFFLRQRAVAPRYDTRADWEILGGLARRLDLQPLAFDSIEGIWDYQLQGTGVTMADFEATGMVSLAESPKYRSRDELSFKTPSGKIEVISDRWEKAGVPSLLPYESPATPGPGQFRLTFGRCAVHTQGHTVNNPLLSEQMPENLLWINRAKAAELKIADGEVVEVSSNGHRGRIKAKVTDFIHPDAVFMVHGFGHNLPVESRALGKGVSDSALMCGGLALWDRAGGAMALQEHLVKVQKITGA